MSQKTVFLFCIIFCFSLCLAGCSQAAKDPPPGEDGLSLVATTTMLADLCSVIGGERIVVKGLMGPGVDPHLYQASAGDVSLLKNADIVVYNGLRLEGKMAEIFENLGARTAAVICVGDAFDEKSLLTSDDGIAGIYDPHIWFDTELWKQAATLVADGLTAADPDHSILYQENLKDYLAELDNLHSYMQERSSELEAERRILVTAHDAFRYFGRAYGFEVRGLQGISTEAEAGTADVSALADFIADKRIKAVFVESSVSPRTIEALQAAVKARGFDLSIGGQLYSDSLGGEGSGAESYILTSKYNIDTIVDALK